MAEIEEMESYRHTDFIGLPSIKDLGRVRTFDRASLERDVLASSGSSFILPGKYIKEDDLVNVLRLWRNHLKTCNVSLDTIDFINLFLNQQPTPLDSLLEDGG